MSKLTQAILKTGGKQYRVEPGMRLRVEKLPGEVGGRVEFDQVLLTGQGDDVTVGTPLVAGAKVTGKIVTQGRHRKLIVYKFKRRKNYRRKRGHRQPYTEVEIDQITG